MCCCEKPNINGTPNAYSWDGKSSGTYRPNPPDLAEGDEMLFDLPGRCGGCDSHSYHLRIVKCRFSGYYLLVRHGAGDERLSLGRDKALISAVELLDDTARYWFLMRFFHVTKEAMKGASDKTETFWRTAAAEKRIKTRKQRKGGYRSVKVWIEPQPV